MVSGAIGERVAAHRRRRGLSQTTLAGLVGRSESWLSQVERGIRSVDSLPVILDLARVLRVEPEKLIGRPWDYAPNGEPVVAGLQAVRGFFTRYDDLLAPDVPGEVDLAVLRSSVASAHQTYQAARYQEVIGQLPSILAGADRAVRQTADDPEQALGYVSAYVVAAKLLTKVGATDLALLAADRATTKAIDGSSDVARGMAAYQVSCALLRADRSDDAEHLAVGMAERVQAGARSDQPVMVSVAGALWLIASVIAARRMDRDEAWSRLDQAESLAGLLGHDGNFAWTAFGPTNVQLHRVKVATEMGDAAEALRAAASVDANSLPEGLTSRRAQVHLDLAWAQAQRKRDAEATLHLLEAERTAPEAVRYNVIVRELIRDMLARAGRTQTSALVDLATRAGVLD
ncbi:MAG TPA: helix-turn-helix transcriptional regulator [Nocardioidaceae bacterium]|nr:helix-turn-helix transcriptional regulator [Nocardioidaceae bacterium]